MKLVYSIVLRDLEESNESTEKKVHFCDPVLERAVVVRDFLELVNSGMLSYMGLRTGGHLDCLARFIKKWDCSNIKALYLSLTRDHCRDGSLSPLSAFRVGAEFGCTATCAVALDSRPRKWKAGEGVDSGEAGMVAGQNILNPAYWPLHLFYRVPVPYQWALLRTFCTQPYEGTPGSRFKEKLKLALESDQVSSNKESKLVGIIQLTLQHAQ